MVELWAIHKKGLKRPEKPGNMEKKTLFGQENAGIGMLWAEGPGERKAGEIPACCFYRVSGPKCRATMCLDFVKIFGIVLSE